MSKSKKIFLVVAAVFIIAIIIVSVDIAQRTTFPGSKPQLKERIQKEYGEKEDSVRLEKDSMGK